MSIELVKEFNDKFDIGEQTMEGTMRYLLKYAVAAYRSQFLREETEEFSDAYRNYDIVGQFDALLDIVYVAQGTALMMGITLDQWNAGMAVVHASNMLKVRAQSAGESKRGIAIDVVKPAGWVGPEAALEMILNDPEWRHIP